MYSSCIARLLFAVAVVAATHGLSSGLAAHAQSGSGPAFSVHEQPAIPLVSLRMSLLADDPPGLAGAGHLFQHLHYPRLVAEAANVGAQVRIDRTPDAVVYTVTGPTAEIRFLASILRSALEPPSPLGGAMLTAHRELAEERLAEWETADRHIRAALRSRLFPMDISAAGSDGSARRLSEAPLDEVWARIYHPDRVSILAVGDVHLDDVQQEFQDLPPAATIEIAREMTDTATLVPMAPAEATRGWFGAGYITSDLSPAAVSVATRLLSDALRERLAGSEVLGEHWWTHHGQAVVLMGALPACRQTTPRCREEMRILAQAPQVIRALPSAYLSELTEEKVDAAARALRHDMLFYSRTPDRMAEVLGQFIDRGGDAAAAQQFYAALASVDASDVRGVLRQLTDANAVRVEIPPQTLNSPP